MQSIKACAVELAFLAFSIVATVGLAILDTDTGIFAGAILIPCMLLAVLTAYDSDE